MSTVLVNEATFKTNVLESSVPVLVDIFTPFCPPCRSLSPILDKIAEQYQGKLGVVKLDGSEYPDLAMEHRVSGVPTLIVFKDGLEVERKSGFQSETQLQIWIDSLLGA